MKNLNDMEWISVKDRLPKNPIGSIYSETVLATNWEDGYPYLAVYASTFHSWHEHDEAPYGKINCITHWMLLPEPPEDDE